MIGGESSRNATSATIAKISLTMTFGMPRRPFRKVAQARAVQAKTALMQG